MPPPPASPDRECHPPAPISPPSSGNPPRSRHSVDSVLPSGHQYCASAGTVPASASLRPAFVCPYSEQPPRPVVPDKPLPVPVRLRFAYRAPAPAPVPPRPGKSPKSAPWQSRPRRPARQRNGPPRRQSGFRLLPQWYPCFLPRHPRPRIKWPSPTLSGWLPPPIAETHSSPGLTRR
ncbi:pneumococcal surface protein A [Xenorhabdus hominickii]|uniref:Pneumococcal surface protein A n=1 Tax=Xenorhabdus hominickii TaxID=351679 RepID=A0A2G0PVI8_XENHO|nr:pneumococcal surface protein A [Xenorhabdus hominickii]